MAQPVSAGRQIACVFTALTDSLNPSADALGYVLPPCGLRHLYYARDLVLTTNAISPRHNRLS